jgi:hypothetical protein
MHLGLELLDVTFFAGCRTFNSPFGQRINGVSWKP